MVHALAYPKLQVKRHLVIPRSCPLTHLIVILGGPKVGLQLNIQCKVLTVTIFLTHTLHIYIFECSSTIKIGVELS